MVLAEPLPRDEVRPPFAAAEAAREPEAFALLRGLEAMGFVFARRLAAGEMERERLGVRLPRVRELDLDTVLGFIPCAETRERSPARQLGGSPTGFSLLTKPSSDTADAT